MAEIGDSCTKETVLSILMTNPSLCVPNRNAFKDWILVGLQLGLEGERLNEIMRMAKAKRDNVIHGVVIELIGEWLKERARTGRMATLAELIQTLKENDLEAVGEAIESVSSDSISISANRVSPDPVITMVPQQLSSPTSSNEFAQDPRMQKFVMPQTQLTPHQESFKRKSSLENEERSSSSSSSSSSTAFHEHFVSNPVRNIENLKEEAFGKRSRNDWHNSSQKNENYKSYRGRSGYQQNKQGSFGCKAKVGRKGPLGLSQFHRAVQENRRDYLVELIKTGGVNINALTSGNRRNTALHLAAESIPNRDDAIKMIKVLIGAGAKVDLLNGEELPFTDRLLFSGGLQNLQKLTAEQFHELVKFLIESGHKTFLETPYGKGGVCLLHSAMKDCILSKQTIEFLHLKNVDLNCQSATGNTLLYYAIFGNRSIKTINTLIQCGADWRHVNNSNWNLLHAAAWFCNLVAFSHFFKMEPKFVLQKTKDGQTPANLLERNHVGNQDNQEDAILMLKLVKQSNVCE